jgi:hypothetical protein
MQAATDPETLTNGLVPPTQAQPKILKRRGCETVEELQLASTKRMRASQ